MRKCAQDCFLTILKSFKSSAVIKKASKLVYSMLENHMALAVKISNQNVEDGLKDGIISKPECQEVSHMLNLLKIVIPYLSVKVRVKVLSEILKLLSSKFSALSRHVFDVIEVLFETSEAEVIVLEAEKIIKSLVSYINLRKKNPTDTVLFAAKLAKCAIDKLHASETPGWITHLPLVTGSIACKESFLSTYVFAIFNYTCLIFVSFSPFLSNVMGGEVSVKNSKYFFDLPSPRIVDLLPKF